MPKVAITKNENIALLISAALEHLDLGEMIRGKVVAVKPNETWADKSDRTACTQGDTLRAVLRHFKKFSPGKLVVTGGAGAAETGDVFRVTGMMAAIEDEGAEFFD